MKQNRKYALAMTVLWCAVFISAMHDWTLGICLGVLMGAGFGLFDTADHTKEEESA